MTDNGMATHGTKSPAACDGGERCHTGQHSSSKGKAGPSQLKLDGKPVSVEVQIEVVEKIQEHLAFGLKMSPPSDVRGILLGRIVKGPPSTIIVEGYELARYASGSSSPALTEDDRLAQLVHYWNKQGGGRRPVGIFRSQRSPWVALDHEDGTCSARLLKHAPNVFLVMQSPHQEGVIGTLFIRHTWKTKLAKSSGEFAFSARILRFANEVELRIEPVAEPPSSRALEQSRPKWRYWLSVGVTWGMACIATVASINAYETSLRNRPDQSATPHMTESRSLGLTVTRAGSLLEILWNPDLAITREAKHATVMLRAEGLIKDVQLDEAQIRAGHLYCNPQRSDLSVRMEVPGRDGKRASESVRLVSLLSGNADQVRR